MSILEFKKVMEAVGNLDEFNIYFSDTYYAIVKGPTPIEVANIIYEKYPNNPYKIRIDGGNEMENPKDHYPYINTYHIDTKEGLIIFISEMKDYYARIQGLEETEVQRFDELRAKVDEEILKDIDPSVSIYEWMYNDNKNRDRFFNAVYQNYDDEDLTALRLLIDEFDKTVNPYSNEKVNLAPVSEYDKKVKINGGSYNCTSQKGFRRKSCCSLQITDLQTQNSTFVFRNREGFSYQLVYTLGEDKYLEVIHCYAFLNDNEDLSTQISEYIIIRYIGKGLESSEIKFNITEGIVITGMTEPHPVSKEELSNISSELTKAIQLASTVTLENMVVKNEKQFLAQPKRQDSNL